MTTIGVDEWIALTKRRPRELPIGVLGRYEFEWRDRESGRVTDRKVFNNTLESGALQRFATLVKGAQPASQVATPDNVSLVLGTKIFSGLSEAADLDTVAATVKGAGFLTKAFSWGWQDSSTSQYSWSSMEFWIGEGAPEPGELHFSTVSGSYLTGDLSKGDDQILTAKFFLEVYTATSTGVTESGLSRLLTLFSHTGLASSAYLAQANMTMQPLTSGGTLVGSAISASSLAGVPSTAAGWRFVSGQGQNTHESNAWDRTRVIIGGTLNFRDGPCRQNGTTCGLKESDEHWEYDYTVTFAQGVL